MTIASELLRFYLSHNEAIFRVCTEHVYNDFLENPDAVQKYSGRRADGTSGKESPLTPAQVLRIHHIAARRRAT